MKGKISNATNKQTIDRRFIESGFRRKCVKKTPLMHQEVSVSCVELWLKFLNSLNFALIDVLFPSGLRKDRFSLRTADTLETKSLKYFQ